MKDMYSFRNVLNPIWTRYVVHTMYFTSNVFSEISPRNYGHELIHAVLVSEHSYEYIVCTMYYILGTHVVQG